jgi:hypothetical protein
LAFPPKEISRSPFGQKTAKTMRYVAFSREYGGIQKMPFSAWVKAKLYVKYPAKEVANLGNISPRFRHFGTFSAKTQHFEIENHCFVGLFGTGI